MQKEDFKQLDTLFSEIQADLPPTLKKRLETIPYELETNPIWYLLSLIPALVWLTIKNYTQISYGLSEIWQWIFYSMQTEITVSILLLAFNAVLAITMIFILFYYYYDKQQQWLFHKSLIS